jgi:maleate isomerase
MTDIQFTSDQPTVGFLTPPESFDPAVFEFPTLVDEPVRVQQCPTPLLGFEYRIRAVARVEAAVAAAARMLAEMGCDVIAQTGTPFAWAGTGSEEAAKARRARISAQAKGVPVVMAGLAIPEALRRLGVRRVALACTYYPDDWRDAWADFARTCGFEAVYARSLQDEGIVPSTADMADLGWSMTDDLTHAAVRAAADSAPEAEAIAVTGAGTRTVPLLAELEAEIGRPVVGADTALYWATARTLGLAIKPDALGRLSNL